MKTAEEKTANLPNIEEHIVYCRAYPGGRSEPASVHLCFDNEDQMHELLEAYHQQKLAEVMPEIISSLDDLIYTSNKLWDKVKPIKDTDIVTVTHPVIEKAKHTSKYLKQSTQEDK